jgi:uncharacterized damage-inducible protein DinB
MSDARYVLDAPPGFRSREAGVFFAELEDQSRRLSHDTRDLTRDELEWQPAPGMNTIGMLLAHIAFYEVFWVEVGPLDRATPDCHGVLGIGPGDVGMPIPSGGRPPEILRGRDLAFFDDLLARARAYTRQALASLGDTDLDRQFTRRRPDGTARALNVRWTLYHMVEHEAAHCGQINLLRRQYRMTQGRS